MQSISEKLEQVRSNIAQACLRSGRSVADVKLVVVTKTASIEAIKEVVRLGCYDLGENRVQHLKQVAGEIAEFLEKEDSSLPENVNWHMIGHLQRNKVRQVLKMSSLIQSVDTLRLAEEVSINACKLGIVSKVMLQVNCSGEPQKYGVPVGAAVHLAEQITTMPNVKLMGLMTMAPLTLDKDVVRASFVRGRELFEDIRAEGIAKGDFSELSMGMSQDYEIAVEEGATILRIGSAIFSAV